MGEGISMRGPIGSWLFYVLGMMLLSGSVHYIRSPIFISNAIKTLKTIVDGINDRETPQWIEVKSHVQSEGYKCGYYVMHWMWNIVSKGLKNDWSMWFGDGTTIDIETITTIRKKWATYFVKAKNT
ncbi:hypothetical protein HKD37_20G056143 [Glycine soja]